MIIVNSGDLKTMKILSAKHKLYLRRRHNKKSRVLVRTARKARHERYLVSLRIFKKRSAVLVGAPTCFDLTTVSNRDVLLLFVDHLNKRLNDGERVIIDFSPTVKLNPGGTLYFVANLDTLLHKFPGAIKCRLPKDEVVEQLFQHIGLLSKLGRRPRLLITAENVVNWHHATGSDATTNAFKALLMQHSDAMGGLITRSSLYDCMSEAVTNTRKHAYPKSVKNLPNWWMFSQASGDALEVVICDLGIGIPKSLLVKPQMRDYFRKLFMVGRQASHDKELIKIATSTNRSSTGLEYRGKGLPQMLDFIKTADDGGFRVQSGSGSYTFSARSKKDKAFTYRRSIKGTIVQWTLKLQS